MRSILFAVTAALLSPSLIASTATLSAAPSTVKFACDGELRIYKEEPPSSYKLRGLYLEIGGQQARVVGNGTFDGIYNAVRTDEQMMFFRHNSDPLSEGNLNRINGDFWLVKWNENKSKAQISVSGECRPYKPLF